MARGAGVEAGVVVVGDIGCRGVRCVGYVVCCCVTSVAGVGQCVGGWCGCGVGVAADVVVTGVVGGVVGGGSVVCGVGVGCVDNIRYIAPILQTIKKHASISTTTT